MLTILNWKESCRYKTERICGNDTNILSPFCTSCRGSKHIHHLLENMVNNTGPFYLSKFDRIRKREYIVSEGIKFYCELDDHYIIYCKNGDIYCVGKLDYNVAKRLDHEDQEQLNNKQFLIDDHRYDFIIYEETENITLDVEVFLTINDIEVYKDRIHDFIVFVSENNVICLGKLKDGFIDILDKEEKNFAEQLGMICNNENGTLFNKINYLLEDSPGRK